jgi:hypothetical protein
VDFTDNRRVSSYSDSYITNNISKENKQVGFFTHYRKYSEELVTALKQWGEGLSFTSCNTKVVNYI